MSSATHPAVDDDRAVVLFHALSDATRIAILRMLRGGERCVCELQDELSAAQSRLSFHLRVLKDAGLVTDQAAGTRRIYQLHPPALEALRAYLDGFSTTALDRFKSAAEARPRDR